MTLSGRPGDPMAVSWESRIDVFARGADDTLQHWSCDDYEAQFLETLGGVLASDPVAVSPAPPPAHVFAHGKGAWQLTDWWWRPWCQPAATRCGRE